VTGDTLRGALRPGAHLDARLIHLRVHRLPPLRINVVLKHLLDVDPMHTDVRNTASADAQTEGLGR